MTAPIQDTTTPATLLARLSNSESGQDIIEYALLAALVALGGVATMPNLSAQISTAFDRLATGVTNTIPATPHALLPPSGGHHDGGDHHGG